MYRNASTAEIKAGFPRSIAIHRQLLGFPDGKVVDHINGNKLDNRQDNLREATYSQNQYNRSSDTGSSQYKGVRWHTRDKKWTAQINTGTRNISLGYFENEAEAAAAYNAAAEMYFGDFAKLNTIREASV